MRRSRTGSQWEGYTWQRYLQQVDRNVRALFRLAYISNEEFTESFIIGCILSGAAAHKTRCLATQNPYVRRFPRLSEGACAVIPEN